MDPGDLNDKIKSTKVQITWSRNQVKKKKVQNQNSSQLGEHLTEDLKVPDF